MPVVLDAFKKYAKNYKKLHFGLADIKNPKVNDHMGKYSGGGKRILFEKNRACAFVSNLFFRNKSVSYIRSL